jgi:hypothetical protein
MAFQKNGWLPLGLRRLSSNFEMPAISKTANLLTKDTF